METKQIYKKIKVMRLLKHWSQETMADKLDITVGSYAKIERGETDVNLSRLMQIAETMEVDLAKLLELNNGNVMNVLENCTNNGKLHNNVYLTETQCAHELEKANLLLQERDKENALLKKQIVQLEKFISMLENRVCNP